VQVYVASLFAPLNFLGTIYNAIVQAFVDMSNLSVLLAEHPDISNLPGATELIPIVPPSSAPSVEFKNVFFRYPAQAEGQGLSGVSFYVKPGTELGVVGSTGAGKSSLFRLLFRLYDPTAGEIFISGQNIRQVTVQSLRATIGIVPQDTALFNETLLFNIKYGNPNATMDQVEEACRRAQILDRIQSFPLGFETMVGGNGAKLSGGEKQRVAIARVLLKDAPILILDESTSSLDSETERQVQESLAQLSSNRRTQLAIAHRLSTIKRANQIIVLERGTVTEHGNHQELLALKGRYYELWNTQEAMGQMDAAKQKAISMEAVAYVESKNASQ